MPFQESFSSNSTSNPPIFPPVPLNPIAPQQDLEKTYQQFKASLQSSTTPLTLITAVPPPPPLPSPPPPPAPPPEASLLGDSTRNFFEYFAKKKTSSNPTTGPRIEKRSHEDNPAIPLIESKKQRTNSMPADTVNSHDTLKI
jgi:hypothetical protein